MLLASSRKLGGTEQKYTANSTRGGKLAGGSLATWASIKEVLRLSMAGTDLGELFADPTSTFEGENPLALAGGTNEPVVQKQAL